EGDASAHVVAEVRAGDEKHVLAQDERVGVVHGDSQSVGEGAQVSTSTPRRWIRATANRHGSTADAVRAGLAIESAPPRRCTTQSRQLWRCRQRRTCSVSGGSTPHESSPRSSRAAVNGTPCASQPASSRRIIDAASSSCSLVAKYAMSLSGRSSSAALLPILNDAG